MEKATKDKLIFIAKATLTAIGGGIVGLGVGTALGRASMGVGALTSAGGFWVIKSNKNEFLGYFLVSSGAGMIASPVVSITPSAVKGLQGLEGFKEDGIAAFKLAFATGGSKLFLDKTPLAKFLPSTVSGLSGDIAMAGLAGLGNSETRKAQAVLEQMLEAQKTDFNKLPQLNAPISTDYGVGNLGSSLEKDYMGAIIDVSEAVGELDINDQQEISGLAAAEDYEMGEMAAEVIAEGGTLEPLAAPGDLLSRMEARKGKAKMGKFRDKMRNFGAKLRGKKKLKKNPINPVGDLPEPYADLNISGLNSDYGV